MSKNLTLKGAAFGALVALSISAVAPASAAGLADKTFVSLAPLTGTEYTVLADQYFDLTANGADSVSGVSGKNLKFLVSDPQSKLLADAALASETQVAVSSSLTGTDAYGSNSQADNDTIVSGATPFTSSATYFAYGAVGDDAAKYNGRVFTGTSTSVISRDSGAVTGTSTSAATLTTQPKVSSTAGLSARAVIIANNALDSDLFTASTASYAGTIPGETITSNRTASGSFVVNSGSYANTSARLLRLVSTSTDTYSATVTAWVDSNGDNAIDSTEYTSETRTVTFQKAGDVTATTTLSPVVGDKVLTATIATTPTLNGQQVLAQNPNFLNAAFTRQGSDATVYAEADKASASQSVVWDDVAKAYSAVVDLDADDADEATAATGADAGDVWTNLAGANDIAGTDGAVASAADKIVSIAVAATNVVTVTTYSNHNLRAGDKVTVVIDTEDSTITGAAESTAVAVTVTGDKTFTYKAAETTALTAATDSQPEESTVITVATYATDHFSVADRVFAGTYTAQAVIETTSETTWTAIGSKASADTASATASALAISTTGSASVQGKTFTAVGTNTTKVKTGTKSVDVAIAVTDADGVAVSAGRTVVVSLSASGTADTFKVNGKSTSATVATDASGKATVTITAVNGFSGAGLQVTALAENIATADIDLAWEDAAIGIVDLGGTAGSLAGNQSVTRTILKGGSYNLDLGVTDQFNTAADSAAYRFKVTGNGVSEGIKTLTAGKASVTVTDTLGTQLTSHVVLQKVTSGVWNDVADWTITSNVVATPGVVLGASGSTTYGNTVVTSAKVAAKALVEIDKRSSTTVTPAYANNVVLNGAVVNSLTSVGTQGAIVTVSGASNILFEHGEVTKKGSLTFVSAASGLFEVKAYSTTALTDSVVTFTSNGKSATIKVTFTGIGVGEGTALTVTTPAKVAAASTFQVGAKLADAYGNGVEATAGRVKVTYTGAGIVFGTLPDKTDATGALSFSALLGAADKGLVTVKVQYDQNGDADFVDAKDLTVEKSILVGVSAKIAKAKNSVATVKNASGLSVTVVRGTKSVTKVATSNSYKVTLKGGSGTVKVYVNDILVASKK